MYEVFLKYDEIMPIGVKGYWGDLCPHIFADIMYWEGETEADINNEEDEGTKIGTLTWMAYNQSLAMKHGIGMTKVPPLAMQQQKQALFNLDYTQISQETLDEIGVASNPNIVVLLHFGISAPYRNKGLGEEVLKGFIEQMTGICGYVVIVDNKPAQFDPNSTYPLNGITLDDLEKDPEKAQWKLNAFLQRCGFNQFKNYDNVFICNVDKVVSEMVKAKATAF